MKRQRTNPKRLDDDNPEWTADDFTRARPAREALPAALVAVLPTRKRGERGPQRTPKGEQRTIRLWPEVAALFPRGEGSNTRINLALLVSSQAGRLMEGARKGASRVRVRKSAKRGKRK